MKLLIVDDLNVNRRLLRMQLEREGHTVLEAAHGVEALEVLERESVDGVVSDILMPNMDGFRLCLEIRKREQLSKLPFVFYTSTYVSPQDRNLARTVGADEYLTKPCTAREILGALELAMHRTRDRVAKSTARQDETYVLTQYNESLVRKLAERNLKVEETLKELQAANLELHESEGRLRLFVEYSPAAIAMVDNEMRYLAVSRRWLADYRLGERDIIGRSHYDVFPEIPERWKEIHRRCLAGAVEKCEEDPFPRADGSTDWVRWEIHPWRRAGGETGGIILFSELITERRLQQQKIERLSRIRALSSGINAAIVHTANRQELLDEACRIAVERGGFGIVWIGKFDPATLDVTAVAWAGVGPEQFTRRTTARADVSEGQGAMGRAIRERKPVYINDIMANSPVGGQRREETIRRGYRSLIALPLIVNDEVFGNLSLFTKELNFFDNEEVELLTEFAGNISFALESLERKEKIDRLSRIRAVTSEINAVIVHARNPQALFADACRIAVEQGRLGSAWIGSLDRATLDITPVAWAGEGSEEMRTTKSTARDDPPRGQGAVSRAVRERRAVFNNDLSLKSFGGPRLDAVLKLGFRSMIALPLFEGDVVVGTFTLYAKEPGFFDEVENALLTELAAHVSFALEHMARQQRIEKLSRIRAVSSEINAATVRSRDKQTLYSEACRIAVEYGKFGIAWIGEIDPERLEVKPVATAGLEDSSFIMQTVLSVRADGPLVAGVLPRAVRDRQPVFNNDITVDAKVGGERRKEAIRRGYRSVIVLPLIVDGAVTATFSMFAKELNYFDDEEVSLLTELAGNISFALDHIARQEKIEKLSRIRSVLGNINTAIVRIHDKQRLLEETCSIAAEQGGLGAVWIGSLDPATLDITPVAWAGEGSEEIRTTKSTARDDPPSGQGPVSRAARERRAVFNNDLFLQSFGSPRRDAVLKLGLRSMIALPLCEGDKVVGTLTLYAKEPGFFDEDETALLTELAGNVSFALEHMARQEKIEKLSRIRAISSEINVTIVRTRGRAALLKEICRIASEHGKFEMVWIGTINHEKREVRPVAWTGFSAQTANAVSWASISATKGTLGEAVHTRKPAVRDDIENQLPEGKLRQEALENGCHSTVSLPLVVDDQVVVLISLFAAGKGFFDKNELALLGEVASNISFALEHIEREEKIARLSRIEAVMGSISGLIVRARDRDELFREACRIAVDEGRFRMSLMGIVDRSTMKIVPVASAGKDEELLASIKGILSSSENAPKTMVARAIKEKTAVVSNDSQSDSAVLFGKKYTESGVRSMAVLPLIVSDEAVGVLALYAEETGFFDDEEMKLLTELTGNIAFAIDHIAKQERLDYFAYYDALTGLANRALFVDRIGQQMRARGNEAPKVALILLNLERFRNINEAFGRHRGDELLKAVAHRLESAFHGKDGLARIGADVFGVVIRGIRDPAAAVHAVENQILGCFREPYKLVDSELRVAARAGIALFPVDGADADTLFKNAEAALKKAQDGGERYLFYAADMNARAAHALSLETRLRKAVEARQFVLHYQPKIELANDKICGLEALIRWQDPEAGLVAPGAFIPLLEETGLILQVGKWALGQALAQHREWTARGCTVPRIAVNVSAIQLQQKEFTEMVISVVQQGGGIPEALELEVTESLLMKDVEGSIRKLSLLRELGIHIAMDDFGTGYSSLSYLARLPLNSLKVDRSFITEMANSPQDMSIVTTIIALAHSLNLRVVAEGVETESQAKLLKLLKCDEAQGYLFSKPLPAAGIEPLLRALALEANEPEPV